MWRASRNAGNYNLGIVIFSRREFLSFAAASLRLSRLGLGCAEGDLYVNNRIGVSIVKPSHWHYISAVDYQSALPRQLLRDDTDDVLFELIKQGVTLPSLLMREKPAEDDSMCPYVGLWAEPLSVVLEEESDYSTEAPDLLAEALKAWGRTLDEFDVMVPPARTRHPVEGGAASSCDWLFRYRTSDGRSWRLHMRSLLATRPPYLFTVHLGARERDARTDLARIESTLRIQRV